MAHSAYVINLETRPDRLAAFQKNRVPDINVFHAIRDTAHPNYGCLKSHKAVLQEARERDSSYVFIFEDDAVLQVPFEKLHEVVRELDLMRPDWEIVVFSVSQYNLASSLSDSDASSASSAHVMLPNGTEVVRLADFNGTYAMAVSCRGYDALIARMEGAKETEDVDINVYSMVCADKIYLTLPFMSYVLSDQSDIRKHDTTGDLEQILLCQSRLFFQTSSMATDCTIS